METAENRHLPLEQTSNHGNSTSNVEEPSYLSMAPLESPVRQGFSLELALVYQKI